MYYHTCNDRHIILTCTVVISLEVAPIYSVYLLNDVSTNSVLFCRDSSEILCSVYLLNDVSANGVLLCRDSSEILCSVYLLNDVSMNGVLLCRGSSDVLCSVYLLNGVFMNGAVLCRCRLMYFALSTYSMVGL